jgi:uncharacterized protein (TIGR02391 family)
MAEIPKNFMDLAYRLCGQTYGISVTSTKAEHPFDERNIHPKISNATKTLFDNGHYIHATFEACKVIEKLVKKKSKINKIGFPLMMEAFNEKEAKIKLNQMTTQPKEDEQSGFKHIFAGLMSGVRNPRAHDSWPESIDECLDNLSLASLLLRKIDNAP